MQPRKWSETHLKRAVHDSTSIRQTLRHLGLAPAGGNYVQIKKYLKLLDLDTSHFKGHAWNKGLKGPAKPSLVGASACRRKWPSELQAEEEAVCSRPKAAVL